MIYASYALTFFWGTSLILMGRGIAGEVVTVLEAIMIGAFSLGQLSSNLQAITLASGAASNIFATINRVLVIDSASPEGYMPDQVEGEIVLQDVDFLYPSRPSVQVLHRFTVVLPKGKMTALVGALGSGNSTIMRLVERFYDPVGGSIELDGHEVRKLNVGWLRQQIGLVP